MKFIVTRTSDWDDSSPCPEATLRTEKEKDGPCDYKWGVKINTLKELLAFVEKHGKVVFEGNHIEIYDYYRE